MDNTIRVYHTLKFLLQFGGKDGFGHDWLPDGEVIIRDPVRNASINMLTSAFGASMAASFCKTETGSDHRNSLIKKTPSIKFDVAS